jgi:hypothetical protein
MTRPTATDPTELTSGSSPACPVSVDGTSLQPSRADRRNEPDRRFLRVRPARHGGEPPGGDQEPRGLRMPGALALLMAHADLEDLTLERDLHHEKIRLEPRWSELVYDGLWFSPLKAGARRLLRRVAAPCHRRGPAPPRPRPVLGGGSAQPGEPLRPRPGHLRRHRHLPAPGRRGLRATVGLGRRHLVGRPAGTNRSFSGRNCG